MGKQPAFQFYPNDWSRDLEEHPLEIEGAWIRICCKLWWAEERGKLNRTVDQWARILRIGNGEVMGIINYIKEYGIGDVTVCNNLVTVINRRMYRGHKERENTRLRVKRHREKQPSNANITPPSSSSSSSSSSKKKSKSSATGVAAKADGIFILTHRKRKLSGTLYNLFNEFWEAFGDKRGRAEAADAWLDIGWGKGAVASDDSKLASLYFYEKILPGAQEYCRYRQTLINEGQIPKMAQGWLSGRRWEDELPPEKLLTYDEMKAEVDRSGGTSEDFEPVPIEGEELPGWRRK